MSEEREDALEMDAAAIGALFAEDEEPERVMVPGHPDSWAVLLPMDATDMNKYVTLMTAARPGQAPRKGHPQQAPPPVDITPSVEHLLCATVVDWCFVGKGRTHTPPEPGRGDPERMRKDALKQLLRAGRNGISSRLQSWLVEQCMQVNHLTEEDQGTEERQGN